MHLACSTPRPRVWTPEDETRLQLLVASGLFVRDVARALNRSQQAVQARANRLGLTLRSAPMRRAVALVPRVDDAGQQGPNAPAHRS